MNNVKKDKNLDFGFNKRIIINKINQQYKIFNKIIFIFINIKNKLMNNKKFKLNKKVKNKRLKTYDKN